jgi:hypothetical protein
MVDDRGRRSQTQLSQSGTHGALSCETPRCRPPNRRLFASSPSSYPRVPSRWTWQSEVTVRREVAVASARAGAPRSWPRGGQRSGQERSAALTAARRQANEDARDCDDGRRRRRARCCSRSSKVAALRSVGKSEDPRRLSTPRAPATSTRTTARRSAEGGGTPRGRSGERDGQRADDYARPSSDCRSIEITVSSGCKAGVTATLGRGVRPSIAAELLCISSPCP